MNRSAPLRVVPADSHAGVHGFSNLIFDVVHCAGIKHHDADALFCLRTWREDKTLLKENLPIFALDSSDDYNTNVHINNASSEGITPLTATVASSVNTPPTENEFNIEQESDPYCKKALVHVGHPHSEFQSNHRGLLIHESTVNNATKIVVPSLLHKHFLHLVHHPPIAGYPGQRRIYDTL